MAGTQASAAEPMITDLIHAAHGRAARRESLSRLAVMLAAKGSDDYEKAIAAGLMTLGGIHGPARQCAELLELGAIRARMEAQRALMAGYVVPGWGCDFVRGKPDPDWAEVHEAMEVEGGAAWDAAMAVEKVLHDAGKNVYLNPAGYTALGALMTGIPAAAASYLIIAGRIAEWTAVFINEHTNTRKLWESESH